MFRKALLRSVIARYGIGLACLASFGGHFAHGQVQTQIFRNTGAISIRDLTNAVPYPSPITVSGITSTVIKVSLTLSNLSHAFIDDVDMLLVNPAGAGVMVMSDISGDLSVTNLRLTIDPSATLSLPSNSIPTNGTYLPTDYSVGSLDAFPSPAPAGPYTTDMTLLTKGPMNGTWKLFVLDDFSVGTGGITNGWSLALTTSNYLAPPVITLQPQNFAGLKCGDAAFSVIATGAPPLYYQWWSSAAPLPGQTQSTLNLSNLQPGDARQYYVVVSNVVATATSSNVGLTVTAPTTEGGDTLELATPICPDSLGYFSSSGYLTTYDPNLTFTQTKWWMINATTTFILYLDTSGSSVDTAIRVYRYNSGGSYTQVSSATTRTSGALNDQSAFLAVTINSGQKYFIAVTSESGFNGYFNFLAQYGYIPDGYFYVTGVNSGGVITNGTDISVYLSLYDYLLDTASMRLFDRGKLIFQRDFQQVLGSSDPQELDWTSPAPGIHSLTLEVSSGNFTNRSSPFDFLVVGRDLGFDRFDALVTQPTNSGTIVSGTLVVRNNSTTSTGDLRVRCALDTTGYARGYTPNQPPDEVLLGAFPTAGHSPLSSGAVWAVPVTPQMQVICPYFSGGFLDPGVQYHIFAILEENQSGTWVVVDRAKIFSSEPIVLFPPNEGQVGQDGNQNFQQFTYLVAPLLLLAPASFNENSSTSIVARVRLSDNTTNSITPTWSVNPPFTISANGLLTAPPLAAQSNAIVTASYTHSIQTLTATQSITVLKLPAPEVLKFQTPQVVAGHFKVTVKGAASKTYQIYSGTNPANLSFLQSITTDATGQTNLDWVIPGNSGPRFFKALRPYP